jgi:hypothetical protein
MRSLRDFIRVSIFAGKSGASINSQHDSFKQLTKSVSQLSSKLVLVGMINGRIPFLVRMTAFTAFLTMLAKWSDLILSMNPWKRLDRI